MALLGQWPWQRMVPIPPELVLLPPSAPFSIYNFACWARQTFVALAVAQSLRPVRPADLDLTAIGALPGRTRPRRAGRTALRRRAVAVAERWIRERQEADGSWGGIQPPWVWGIIALAALGHGLDDPTLGKAVEGWQGFMVEDGERLRPEACQSPVWDTALALLALRACGVPDDHRAARPRRRVPALARRCASRATGRSAGPTSLPAAGRSSTRTTTTPTSTTRPSSRSRCTAWASARRTRSRAASTGSSACSRAAAAGARSTSTTTRCGSTRSRSATSAR